MIVGRPPSARTMDDSTNCRRHRSSSPLHSAWLGFFGLSGFVAFITIKVRLKELLRYVPGRLFHNCSQRTDIKFIVYWYCKGLLLASFQNPAKFCVTSSLGVNHKTKVSKYRNNIPPRKSFQLGDISEWFHFHGDN